MTQESENDGYYTHVKAGIESAYQKGINDGASVGVVNLTEALYRNSMTSESETLFNLSALAMSLTGNGANWEHPSYSANETRHIPLYKYDSNGNIVAILNTLQLSVSSYAKGPAYSASASASNTYTLYTDTGVDLTSNGKMINLFGTDGLTGATELILNSQGYASVSMGGTSGDCIMNASASTSYTAQYISIS